MGADYKSRPKALMTFYSAGNLPAAGARYVANATFSATENPAQIPIAIEGHLHRLAVHLLDAPGGADTVTAQVRVNGNNTGITVVITGANTTGIATGTFFAVVPEDLVCLIITLSATATTTTVYATLEILN